MHFLILVRLDKICVPIQKKGNYYNYNTNYTTQLPLLLPTESE